MNHANVLRQYARDTGAFRVNKQGATDLAAALAAVAELVEAARRAATASVRGNENWPGTIRNADLDALRAALARFDGGVI